jgi:cyclophilin family peptidyl-prolyl cis-trans isomerase
MPKKTSKNHASKNRTSKTDQKTNRKEHVKPAQKPNNILVDASAKAASVKIQDVKQTVKHDRPATPEKTLIRSFQMDFKVTQRLIAVLVGLVVVGGFLWFSFSYVPHLLDQTDEAKIVREKEEKEKKEREAKEKREKQLAEENQKLSFQNQKVDMQIKDFGTLRINLKYDAAPKTVESFVRLTYRNYFNDTKFHRMVLDDNFKIIQGGDPTGVGNGGESAFGTTLPDELWATKPIYDYNNGQNLLTNQPAFRDPSLYTDFKPETGQVTYRKGLIVMAKTSAPDSAGSQFFITLDKTILPAEYTVFGEIDPSSFPVLDKIATEVQPVPRADGGPQDSRDGAPNRELKIETATLVQ